MAKNQTVAGTELDPTIQFAELEIGGKKYFLCYDFGNIARAEKDIGANLLAGFAGFLLSTATASQFLGLLYAALMKAQPKMTLGDAAKLVQVDTLPLIRDALSEAYALSMPPVKKDPPEADPAAVN